MTPFGTCSASTLAMASPCSNLLIVVAVATMAIGVIAALAYIIGRHHS